MNAVAERSRRSLVGRYYDPQTGQFVSRDQLEDGSGQAYAYAGDDPTNNADPTGLLCLGDWCPSDSLEFAKGEIIGAGKFALGTAKAVVHPVGFVDGLTTTCLSGYSAQGGGFDGALRCIDNLNPFSGFVRSLQADCPEQAGEEAGGSLAATFATLAGGVDAPGPLDLQWRVRGRGFHLHLDRLPHAHLGSHLQLDTWRKGVRGSGRSFRVGWGWPPWG
jgi:hypothetical protein